MAKRIFAMLWVFCLTGFVAPASRAESMPVELDGCARLARVIYTEVAAAAMYGPGRSGPWLVNPGQDDIAVCEHAARTVSRAFTAAMLSAGIDVYWEPSDPGDYCLSAFLSQCYPDRYPLEYPTASMDFSYVRQSWLVVSRSVMQAMHNPISSDEVRFRRGDLKLRLGLSLRSVNRWRDD